MVVFSDMMFRGFGPPRWSPVERLISCRFTSVLISSEGVDGILISTPMPSVTAMLFEVLITCILGQITRAPDREACRLPFTNNPFDSEDLTPICSINLSEVNFWAAVNSAKEYGSVRLFLYFPLESPIVSQARCATTHEPIKENLEPKSFRFRKVNRKTLTAPGRWI